MLITNTFTVPVPVDEVWSTLLDIQRIAPCLPGAVLDSSDGDTHRGRVKVKVGPIGLSYRGEATITEKDDVARRMVLTAAAKESRGGGAAKALVTAQLHEGAGATEVRVSTELDLTGKPAQFGRSIISDVSGRLVDQFAANLAALMQNTAADQVAAPRTSLVHTEPAFEPGTPDVELPRPTAAPSASVQPVSPAAGTELDAWSLVPAPVRRALLIGAPLVALVTGYLVGRCRE